MYTKMWALWYKSSLTQLVRWWTSDPEMRYKVDVQVRIAFSFFKNFFFHLLIFLTG